MRVNDVVTVQDDVDSWDYFTSDYGLQVGPRVWAKYEAAQAEVARLRHMMEKSKRFRRAPLPAPGTFARRLHDGYMAMLTQQIESSNVFFALSTDTTSQDDGSLERLRQALDKP